MANTYSAGIATAYGAAVRGGYSGTYDDFCRQQAEYAESAAAVEQAKEDAEAAATAAEASKTAAASSATNAAGSASAAATSEGQASTSATNAANSATAANASKNAAATSATEAENAATSAAGSAATAQGVLESIPPSYDDLADEVADLKEDLSALYLTDDDIYKTIDIGETVRRFTSYGVEKGQIASSNGQNYDAGIGYRTSGYITFPHNKVKIRYTGNTTNLRFRYFWYNASTKAFVDYAPVNSFDNTEITIDTSYVFRIMLYYTDASGYPDPDKLFVECDSEYLINNNISNISAINTNNSIYASIGDGHITRPFTSYGVERGLILYANGENYDDGIGYRTNGFVRLPSEPIHVNYVGNTTNLRMRLWKYNPIDKSFIELLTAITDFNNSKIVVDSYYIYRITLEYTDNTGYADYNKLTFSYIKSAPSMDLSCLNWVYGKQIYMDGSIGNGYSQYTDGMIEFENEVVIFTDSSPNSANRIMRLCIYDSSGNWVDRVQIDAVTNQLVRVDTTKKYRLLYMDSTSTEVPEIDGLSITFKKYSAVYQRPLSSYRTRKPMLSIVDDDGMKEYYTALFPIVQQYNIPIASAVEGYYNPYGYNHALMSYQQIKTINEAGCEILGHGNGALESKTLAEAETDVKETKRIIESLGIPCRGYVYPASSEGANPNIRAILSKYYEFAIRGAEGQQSDYRYNSGMIGNYFIIRVNGGGYYDNNTGTAWSQYNGYDLDYFKALIDAVKANNGWLVLMLHSYFMVDGQKQSAYENIDQIGLLESIIQYAISQNVDIVNPSEGFDVFGNEWQAGDYLGLWNEDFTKSYHTKAGCAVDRIGNFDFPSN